MPGSGFSLGDGVSSITGRKVGRGVILNKILPSLTASENISSKSKKQRKIANISDTAHITQSLTNTPINSQNAEPIRPFKRNSEIKAIIADKKNVGSVKYSVHFINDYERLRQALNIKANISAILGSAGSISAAMEFSKSITLNRENITLIVIGEYVSHIDSIPRDPELAIDEQQLILLKEDSNTFKDSNGDHFVSDIVYGAIFFAEITILRTSAERGEEFKLNVEAGVNDLAKGAKFGIGSKNAFKKDKVLKKTEMNIKIMHIGAPDLGAPKVSTNLNDFALFVSLFNRHVGDNIKKGNAIHPIDYATESYVSLLKIAPASHMLTSVELTTELLRKFDNLMNRIRLVMPTAKSIIEIVNRFTIHEENADKVNRLHTLYSDAELYLDIIKTIMIKIDSAQTDIATLRLKLTDKLDLRTSSMRAPESSKKKGSIDITETTEVERTFNKRDNLLNIANFYTRNISKLERDIEDTIASLKAELITITFKDGYFTKSHLPNTGHFHLKTPSSNATLQWSIFKMDDTPLNTLQFDVVIKKTGKYFYKKVGYQLAKLQNNAITELVGLRPGDRYKIAHTFDLNGNRYIAPFKITISICGAAALKVRNGLQALANISPKPPEDRECISEDDIEFIHNTPARLPIERRYRIKRKHSQKSSRANRLPSSDGISELNTEVEPNITQRAISPKQNIFSAKMDSERKSVSDRVNLQIVRPLESSPKVSSEEGAQSDIPKSSTENPSKLFVKQNQTMRANDKISQTTSTSFSV